MADTIELLMCSEHDLNKNLSGKVFVVTGATGGIGFEAAKQFWKQGATVVLASRNQNKLDKAVKDIMSNVDHEAVKRPPPQTVLLDLGNLKSVRWAAKEVKERVGKIDVLLNNAGVQLAKKQLTPQDLEGTIGTNHFGHFLWTELLLDHLKDGGRVVNVSSCFSWYAWGHKAFIDFDDMNFEKRAYDANLSYAQAKLGNFLHAIDLSRRKELQSRKITAVALHPGGVDTNIMSDFMPWFMLAMVKPMIKFFAGGLSPWVGAQTSLHCCLNDSVPEHNGKFFSQAAPLRPGWVRGWEPWEKHPELQGGGWPMPHPGRETGAITDEIVDRFRDVGFETTKKWRSA